MDATALRWVLGIIGVVIIAGVYLYGLYQQKSRKRAAIKTFTHEELESGIIEDEALSRELSSINSMLDEELRDTDLKDIKINPALDATNDHPVKRQKPKPSVQKKPSIHLPDALHDIEVGNLVAHVLKHADDRVLTGIELLNAFKHLELEINHEGYAEAADSPVAQYRIANMSRDGSLNEISDSQFYSYGIVCFYDASTLDLPLNCYELMLKKIDELVRLLELKVYNEDLQLLTLQHVTEIRERLKGFE